jgi:hypothetical protein
MDPQFKAKLKNLSSFRNAGGSASSLDCHIADFAITF